jgi:hypothetical protein
VVDLADKPAELGVKFSSSVSGYIIGLRFYSNIDSGPNQLGSLWDASGNLLASATFVESTPGNGWQQVNFATPVAIAANTTYVAGYFASTGHYSITNNYFANAGVDNGVVHAPSNAAAGGNGVYAYSSSSVFPTLSWGATNYWVDVVFSNVLVPSIASTTPLSGSTLVPRTTSITATFNESVLANSISFVLHDSANNPVAATVSYNDSTHTAMLQPAAALAVGTTYTATVTGATDAGGMTMTAPVSWSFTTSPTILNASIWSPSATPAVVDLADKPVELGVKFSSSVSGYITGLRFYSNIDSGPSQLGSLWDANGNLLATATFVESTPSNGWQQVNFATPVAITANTTYVAGYFASTGHYSITNNYFASVGVDNGVLHAPSNAAAGGNGVYAYSASSVFPTLSWGATNYWVDVVFSNVLAPAVASTTPVSGATQVPKTTSITATFNESVLANSISFVLHDSANNPVAATVSYNDSTHTATLQPAAALAAGTTYTATVTGATDAGGMTMTAPVSWSFTTTPTIVNASIWGPSATPAVVDLADKPVELGVKFSSSVSGYIMGLRFYSNIDSGPNQLGSLWDANGNLLATATFVETTPSNGWQQVNFATPVAINANTTYVAGYFASTGHYSITNNYFANAGVDNGVLHAPSNAAAGGNGVYAYSASSVFPTLSWGATNYWVDVVFSNVPSVVSTTPLSGATLVPKTTSITATFNESVLANSISFVLHDTANNPVAATVSYNDSTHTATLQPVAALAAGTTYTATVSGTTDANGMTMTVPVSWSFTTTPTIVNASIWGPSATPAVVDLADKPVELGVKFSSSVSGYITGLRFYSNIDSGPSQLGSLWDANGNLLATATFVETTPSNGWQQVNFATPVAISANTTYVAGYFASTGHYSITNNYFASVGVDNGVLHAPSNAAAGGNGVYAYSSSSVFPTLSWGATNYWVDVVFSNSVTVAAPAMQHAVVATSWAPSRSCLSSVTELLSREETAGSAAEHSITCASSWTGTSNTTNPDAHHWSGWVWDGTVASADNGHLHHRILDAGTDDTTFNWS